MILLSHGAGGKGCMREQTCSKYLLEEVEDLPEQKIASVLKV